MRRRWLTALSTLILWASVSVDLVRGSDFVYPLVLTDGDGDGARDAFECRNPVPPMVDMSNIDTFYKGGATQSVIDKEAMAAYVKRNQLVDKTRASLRSMVQRAVTAPDDRDRIGTCITQQLLAWAKADALLGNLDKNDPKGRRQAILITAFGMKAFTDSYSVAVQIGAPTKQQRAIVEAWLGKLGDAIIAEFTPPSIPRPKKDRWLDRNANTRYWGAAAVGLVATLTEDKRQFDWAINVMRTALAETDADGSFPLELKRGGRSLGYQNFAMRALTILVVLADRNGVRLSQSDEKRLAAAARFSADAFDRPEVLEVRTGKEQVKKPEMTLWMRPLSEHFENHDRSLSDRLKATSRQYDTASPTDAAYLLGLVR